LIGFLIFDLLFMVMFMWYLKRRIDRIEKKLSINEFDEL